MTHRLRLFEATGIEIEYMIVDRETLSVKPIADVVLGAAGADGEAEVERNGLAWSNELALHVIELKTNGPVATLDGLGAAFQQSTREIDAILRDHGARLMPTAMHPWMAPDTDLVLWPHEAAPIYQAFHRIFDCRGHGWANVQSVHVNLSFADDEEFGRLHAAIRVLLPILPALAASSPVADGTLTGLLDTRMGFYCGNARRIPSVCGLVVPERVYTRADYAAHVLEPIYRDLAPHDPEGTLHHEWVNARGAIARFDRYAVEIRVLDVQEHPGADVAICAAVRGVVQALTEGRLGDPEVYRDLPEDRLAATLQTAIRDADHTIIDDTEYTRALGYRGAVPVRAIDLWRHLIGATIAAEPGFDEWSHPLEIIFADGCLARRIATRLGTCPSRMDLKEIYGELCDCLAAGRMFRAHA